jgi:hypothetical protein
MNQFQPNRLHLKNKYAPAGQRKQDYIGESVFRKQKLQKVDY